MPSQQREICAWRESRVGWRAEGAEARSICWVMTKGERRS